MQQKDQGERVGREVFGDGYITAKKYVDILATTGVEWGLIGPKETPRLWQRHVLNSVALVDLIPEGASVADVGSGAGLPGIPLAIGRTDLQVTLVEPMLRRCTFLEQTVDELGLDDRVKVVRGRAEEVGERFDVVTARAVAKLATLVGWSEHLFSPGGELLALKGQSAQAEVDKSVQFLAKHRLTAEVLVVRAHPEAETTHVTRVRRA